MFRRVCPSALMVFTLTVPGSAQESDASATRLFGLAAEAYAALDGLCSTFHQTLEVTLLRRTTEGTGELCQQGASLFSMRFHEPAGDAVVVDGTHMWMYTPSTDPSQVLRFRAEGNDGRFNFYRTFLEAPETSFIVTDEGSEVFESRAVRVLSLAPREPGGSFIGARLWIDPASFLIVRIAIEDANESIRTITLTDPRPDPELPADFFEFVVPAGARVVER